MAYDRWWKYVHKIWQQAWERVREDFQKEAIPKQINGSDNPGNKLTELSGSYMCVAFTKSG